MEIDVFAALLHAARRALEAEASWTSQGTSSGPCRASTVGARESATSKYKSKYTVK